MHTASILVINPGSTSTRVALYSGNAQLAARHLQCTPRDLAAFPRVLDQVDFRRDQVLRFLDQLATPLHAIAARGAPLAPVPGGVYRINDAMIHDARSDRFVEHPSRTACIIARELADQNSIPAFIVDPISTDEYEPISRISGLAQLPRKSLTHALNMKRVARKWAEQNHRAYNTANLLTAHLGGGCSIAIHHHGRMVDSVDANGEGPMSPERSGGLRTDDLARLAIDAGQPFSDLRRRLTRKAGLLDHLGTADGIEIEHRIAAGDPHAQLVYQAMAYQVARHIAALSVATSGSVDAILLTGGLANSQLLTGWIADRVRFIAPVSIFPGEYEMEALHEGVQRALAGHEPIRVYPGGDPE